MTKTITTKKSPFTGGRVFLVETTEEHEFRGEQFEVFVRYYLCEDTGEQFTGDGQDDFVLNQIHNQWRIRHALPFTEDIKATRLRYDLSISLMSKILGISEKLWEQYEDGLLPSESHGKMIRAMENKAMLLDMLTAKRLMFSDDEFQCLTAKIRTAPDKTQENSSELYLQH